MLDSLRGLHEREAKYYISLTILSLWLLSYLILRSVDVSTLYCQIVFHGTQISGIVLS